MTTITAPPQNKRTKQKKKKTAAPTSRRHDSFHSIPTSWSLHFLIVFSLSLSLSLFLSWTDFDWLFCVLGISPFHWLIPFILFLEHVPIGGLFSHSVFPSFFLFFVSGKFHQRLCPDGTPFFFLRLDSRKRVGTGFQRVSWDGTGFFWSLFFFFCCCYRVSAVVTSIEFGAGGAARRPLGHVTRTSANHRSSTESTCFFFVCFFFFLNFFFFYFVCHTEHAGCMVFIFLFFLFFLFLLLNGFHRFSCWCSTPSTVRFLPSLLGFPSS